MVLHEDYLVFTILFEEKISMGNNFRATKPSSDLSNIFFNFINSFHCNYEEINSNSQ